MHIPSIGVRKLARLLLVASGVFLFAGCISRWNANRHQASSVVQFLYPGKDQPFIQPGIPTLRLPLRIAIAFVPSANSLPNGRNFEIAFTEAQKNELMRAVATKFRALPFVQSIELVPTTYLRPGGGFENLDQIRALMGVDVVALIAYDQSQLTSDTAWSLSYWTIVGAYIVPARKNDTATLMEAVVYDIASRRLLFRAPGVNTVRGNSTPVNSEARLREDSKRSYLAAAQDLTVNLQQELDAFKVRAKEEPESVKIEHKAGYRGAGAAGGPLAALVGWLVVARVVVKRLIFLSRKRPASLPLSRTNSLER